MNALDAAGDWCRSPWLLGFVAPAAAFAGWLVARGAARLVGDGQRSRWPVAEISAAAVAAGVWWWEVRPLASLPTDTAPETVCLRCVAHLVLFALLAAAAWVDLRRRVIPDSITVPGVLGGLAWNALVPATLLPIGYPQERPEAPPRILPDVLAAWGPLRHTDLPDWAVGAAGLAAAIAVFTIWWSCGLPAADSRPADGPGPVVDDDAGHPDARIGRLRVPIAVVGGAGILAAWLAGGEHWKGLLTALTGLAVAAGMIWATRAGASRALGREALGFGDVTLMAMAGSWLGWQACLLACVIAVFIGLAHGLVQVVRHAESELPFGPSLCLGLASVVLLWRPIWSAAAPQFQRPLELAVVVTLVIGMTAASLWAWWRLGGRTS